MTSRIIDKTGKKFSKLLVLETLKLEGKPDVYCRCRCDCGSEIVVKSSNLTSGNTKSCGCTRGLALRDDLSGNIYGSWTVLYRINDSSDRHTKWMARCSCGTEKEVYQDNLVGGKTFSCGCNKVHNEKNVVNKVGTKWGLLTVIERVPSSPDQRGIRWKCICSCGETRVYTTSELYDHKSCGCLEHKKRNMKDITGERFGLLTVVKRVDMNEFKTKPRWLCSCDCGESVEVLRHNLISGNTRSCGCLDDRVNTKPVSKQQRAIAEMLGGELNHKVEKLFIDVVLLDKKIGIEYDSHYWHSMNEDHDHKKTNILLNNGWKILRIKSDWKVPTEDELQIALKELETKQYTELVLDDWISREQKYGKQTYS